MPVRWEPIRNRSPPDRAGQGLTGELCARRPGQKTAQGSVYIAGHPASEKNKNDHADSKGEDIEKKNRWKGTRYGKNNEMNLVNNIQGISNIG